MGMPTVSIEAANRGKKKGAFKNFSNLLAAPTNLLKKRLWHMCFPVNFAKFSRTSFPNKTSGQGSSVTRRNNNKVDSIETWRIVIAHLLP